MKTPTSELVMRWLQQARIEHYVCDQCHGIHIVSLQSVEGMQESRIFIEEEWIMFSSELELRPAMLFHALADIGRLNVNFPALKIFLDVVDDNLPRLVVGHTVLTKAGLTEAQFLQFVDSVIAATHQIVVECERAGLLNIGDEVPSHNAIH
ncbi:MAG: YbjN domain-containing protein [Aeromonas sp.]